MANRVERTIYSISETADWLSIDERSVLELLIKNELEAVVKAPFPEIDSWFTLSSQAIKESFERGLDSVDLVTVEENETFGNWEKTLKWSQVFILKSNLELFELNQKGRRLIIIKSDFTEFSLGNETFRLEPRKAIIVKILYDRSKTTEPEIHESEIFEKADRYEYPELRIDKALRTTKEPKIVDNVILKTKPATYQFSKYFL